LRNDRRRFCTRGTVGGPRSASAIRAASRNRPPQQLDRLKSGIGMGLFLFALLLLSACHRAMPEQATWAGTIDLAQGDVHMPFRMVLDLRSAKPAGYFLVADEKTPIPEITRQGDSLIFGFSEYGAQMRGTWNGARLNGTYIRHRTQGNTLLNFSAVPEVASTVRTEIRSSAAEFPSANYQVFFEGADRSQSTTLATFWVEGETLRGTFIAPDGDYGLLVGNPAGGKVQLNRFTGWQAIAITLEQRSGMWAGNYFFQNDKPKGFILST